MKHATKLIAAALIAAAGVGCGEAISSAADRSGTAVVSMTSNYVADGAILVAIRGPGLSAAAAENAAYTVFSRLVGPNELHVIVLGGSVGPGDLFTVGVGAVNRLSAYSARVEQVATQGDSLRPDVSSYKALLAAEPN
jgi:hypothetical protein